MEFFKLRSYNNADPTVERDIFLNTALIIYVEVRPYQDGEFTKYELIARMVDESEFSIQKGLTAEHEAQEALRKIFV